MNDPTNVPNSEPRCFGQKLSLLADWFDLPANRGNSDEVQKDLRAASLALAGIRDVSTVAAKIRLADAVLAAHKKFDETNDDMETWDYADEIDSAVETYEKETTPHAKQE